MPLPKIAPIPKLGPLPKLTMAAPVRMTVAPAPVAEAKKDEPTLFQKAAKIAGKGATNEKVAAVAIDEALRAFKEKKAGERERFADLMDSEHWFSVSCGNRAMKEWMLEALGFPEEKDKYLTAEEVWAAMRAIAPRLPPMPDFKVNINQGRQRDKALMALADPLPGQGAAPAVKTRQT